MHAIEIQNLSKNYPVGFWKKQLRTALKPLNLAVSVGETFGFLGPNGAGKTTTIKLLMGIIFPSSGTASILGKPFDDPEIKRKIGFLPEQPYFYDYLSAPELLDYYGSLSGMTAGERKSRIPQLLDLVGLGDVGKKQLRKFSKGMLQRVGIAQAILHDPEVVLLDEPMSGLDPLGRHEIRELIQRLKDQGKTIFFSTHILSDAEALCDRVAIIHKGEVRGIGVISELRSTQAGTSEVVWEGKEVLEYAAALVRDAHITGALVRARVESANLDGFLEALRRYKGRLISVTPLHGTLEQYFLEKTSDLEAVQG